VSMKNVAKSSAVWSPDPLAGFNGLTSKGREGGKGKGRELTGDGR